MTVSMEGIQGNSAAFGMKEPQQGTGAFWTGGATPFVFMKILNQISGALDSSSANAKIPDNLRSASEGAGKLLETLAVGVDLDGNLGMTSRKAITNLVRDISDALADSRMTALGCNDQASSELQRIIGAVESGLKNFNVAVEPKLRTENQNLETGMLQSVKTENGIEPTMNLPEDLQTECSTSSKAGGADSSTKTEKAVELTMNLLDDLQTKLSQSPERDAADNSTLISAGEVEADTAEHKSETDSLGDLNALNERQTALGVLTVIECALRKVEDTDAVYSGQNAAQLSGMVDTLIDQLKNVGNAQNRLEAVPAASNRNTPQNSIVADPVRTVMNLLADIKTALSQADSTAKSSEQANPVVERIIPALRTGGDKPGLLNAADMNPDRPLDSLECPRPEAQEKDPVVTVVIKNEAGETEIDLTALKSLLNEGDGPASATSNHPASADRKSNQDPIRQNLIQALTALNEGKRTDVVVVKVLQAGTERNFSLRPDSDAPSASSAMAADTAESVSLGRSNASFGDKLSSALNLRQSEDQPDAIGKQNQPVDNKSGDGAVWRDPESTTPLKSVVVESKIAPSAKDSCPAIATGEIEQKAAVKTDGLQAPHRGEQAPIAGANSFIGNDRKEIQVEPQAVIRQVAEGAEEALNKGVSRIRMELTPPRLGALDMDLVVSHDRVRMVILADNQDARNILQSNMDQLRSSLQQQGLKIDGVEVFVQDRSAGGQSGNLSGHAWGQPGSGNGGQFQEGRYFSGNGWSEKTSTMDPVGEDQRDRTQMRNGAGLSVFA